MRSDRALFVMVSVLVTLLVLTPVAYMAYRAMPPRIASVDLQLLVEEDQQRTVEVLNGSAGAVSEEQRRALQKLTEDFARRLSAAVDAVGDECRCVIVNKAALLGGATIDYTDAVRERIGR